MVYVYRLIFIFSLFHVGSAFSANLYQAYIWSYESGLFETKEEAANNLASVVSSGREVTYTQCYVNGKPEKKVSPYNWRIKNGMLAADKWTCGGFQTDFYPGGTETWSIDYRTKSDACPTGESFDKATGRCIPDLTLDQACGAAFYGNNDWTASVRLAGNVSDGTYCQPMGDSIKPGLACAMNFNKNMAWKTDDGNWHSEGTLQPQMVGGKFQGCVPGLEPTEGPPDPAKPPELPKKQDPSCPNGYKGDVGGKEACIPSYGYNGVDFAPKTKYSENDKTRTETTTKTECAEGKCTTTVTEKVTDKATGQSTTTSSSTTEQDRDWCAKPKNKDQCAANGKPAYSGQGTGVSGGGSGSGNGNGNGDGDDQGGKCGAKNQPPCKIDEQGTPDGKNAFDDAKGQLDRDHQSKLDTLGKIQSAGDKNTSLGFDGGFAWLTHRTCMPWNFGALEIYGRSFQIEVNVCPIESIISPVMNFLWILGTLFATIYRVSAVMGAKVE